MKIKYTMADEPSSESEQDSQQSSDEEDEEEAEESPEETSHPYPTPPPDADANMSLGNGVHKIIIQNPKESAKKTPKTKMASVKKETVTPQVKLPNKKNVTTISLAMNAIEALASRSGSSVPAIVKYIKSTGYEIADPSRFSRLLLRVLKAAVIREELVQVKKSFKLSEQTKLKSKAMIKMQAKAEKQKAKAATIKPNPKPTAAVKPKQFPKKATERKTKEKPKKSDKATAEVAGTSKAAAAAKAQAALGQEPQKTKPKKAAKEKLENPKADKSANNSKSKAPRKSIVTLAPPKGKQKKLPAKSVKKLAAGRPSNAGDGIDEAEYEDLAPTNSSTPIISAAQKKRKARAV